MNASPTHEPAPLCPIPRRGIDGSAGVILHILLLLATLSIGVGVTAFTPSAEPQMGLADIYAAAVTLLSVIHLWRVTRTAKGTVPLLIAVGVFLTFYTQSILPAGIFCGLVFTVSEGSLLIAVQPKGKLAVLPLIPLLAYGVTAFLSRDLVTALVVLLPWPAAWALAVGTRRSAEREDGPNRVGVICGTALALGLSAAALCAIALYRALGTLHPADLAEALEELRLALIAEIHSLPMPEGLTPDMIELWEEMSSYAAVENTVNSVLNLFPAIFVVAVLLLSAACQSIQHAALRAFGLEECITNRVKAFEMSLLSCVIFLVAYLAVFLDDSATSSAWGTLAQNLYVILMPGLALAGLLRLTRSLTKKGRRAMGCLFYVVTLAFCLLFFAPFILAAVEVIGHIFEAITSKLKFSEDNDDPF